MTGLKLLFSRYFSHRRILVGVLIFFVLMMAAVIIFHEDPGGDPADYLMCKVGALTPALIALFLPVIFMAQDTQGNRFMRAVPCAESLYMHGIPVFSVLASLGWVVLTDAAYAAFILATGRDICNISDMLVMSAMYGGILVLVSCLVMSLRFGGIFFILFYSPALLTFIISVNVSDCGYGLPLWASLLIFLGSFIAAFAVGLTISGIAYKKENFRELTTMQTGI